MTASAPGALDSLAILAQAPIPLLVLEGTELRIVVANDELRRQFGVEAAVGASAAPLLPPALLAQATNVRDTGTAERSGELTLPTAAGERRYRAALQPLRDHAGTVTGVILAYEDITDHTAARQALHAACAEAEQASRLKDGFINTAAHELRAPLMTLLLWENLLRSGLLTADDRERALDAIRDSAAALSKLIGDLQDLSRAVSGTLELDIRMVDLDALLRDGVTRFTAETLAREVVLDAQLQPGLGAVAGNAQRLQQVLATLLGTAAQHTPPGGRIALAARRSAGSIVIEVSDTGRGIKRELLPYVFEPFSKIDDALARSEGGLGLGLAISRELVRLHGGTLVADSPGLDRGSTFTIALPTSDDDVA